MSRKWIVVALCVLAGVGGWIWFQQADPLTKLVNSKWPPITVDQQRQAAIESTTTALRQISAPNVRVSVKLSDAQRLVLTDQIKRQGVTDIKIVGDSQLVQIKASFARVFTEADAGNDQALKDLLGALKPDVAGRITAYFGISDAVATPDNVPQLQLKLLPVLGAVEIDHLKVAGSIDITRVAEAVTSVLNRYKDNITGELTRAPFTTVNIPAASAAAYDPHQTLTIRNADASLNVEIAGNPVSSPVRLDGIAWLVDNDRLIALVQFSQTIASPAPSVPLTENSFKEIKRHVDDLGRERFGIDEGVVETSVAMRKTLIAGSLNSVMSQAGLCIRVQGETSEQKSSTTIDLPSGEGIDCSSNRDCAPKRQCDFPANHDTRDCNRCLVWKPKVCAFGGCVGGGCGLRGNDPTCELSKAAQNKIYEADAASKKLDCERLKSTEKLTCEAEKTGEKMLCEAGKETLNRLRATGKFANLDLDTKLVSQGVRVCLKQFYLSESLNKLQFGLDVSGSVQSSVDVKFVPLDIVGHLTCQFPWTDRKTFNASLRDSNITLNSDLRLVKEDTKARLDFAVQETTIKASVSPSPTEYLLTSTNMTLACQGLNLVKPLVVLLTPFIPKLRGEIDHKLKRQEGSMGLPLPDQKVGEVTLKLFVQETPQALTLNARPVN